MLKWYYADISYRSHFKTLMSSLYEMKNVVYYAIHILYMYVILQTVGGTVALWLVPSAPWVLTLAWGIVLCPWGKLLTLTEPLSAQLYK